MKTNDLRKLPIVTLIAVLAAYPAFAETKAAPSNESPRPNEAEMMAMMTELAKPSENHKLLAAGVGSWTYTVKMWMDPSAPPSESSGTSVTKEIMGGRYFISEHTGKMQMPGPDGKLMDVDFKGMAVEGYDNVKKKFISSWVDNMGTGIMLSEGEYDATAKTFTYRTECEMMPGVKSKIRQMIKINDKDHRTFEFYEVRGEAETKTMEIKYARKT